MTQPLRRSILFGSVAALGMLAVYLGILTLLESWIHAVSLLREDAVFVGPLAAGFGIQVGLYTYIRRAMKLAGGHAGAMAGASGGTSTTAMIACCAHHVTDLLPLIGLSAAATFLARYKVWLMSGALLFNAAGIVWLSYQIYRWARHHQGVPVASPNLSLERQG